MEILILLIGAVVGAIAVVLFVSLSDTTDKRSLQDQIDEAREKHNVLVDEVNLLQNFCATHQGQWFYGDKLLRKKSEMSRWRERLNTLKAKRALELAKEKKEGL